jgi:hypothetical protein
MRNPFKKSFGQQVVDAALSMVPGMERTWTGRRRFNGAKAAGQVAMTAVIGGVQFAGKALGVACVNAFDRARGKAAANEAPQQEQRQEQRPPRQETTRRPEGQRTRHTHTRVEDSDEQAVG